MVIPKQYNHYIYVSEPGTAELNADGDFEAEVPTWEFLCMGREEPNGKGEVIETSGMKPYRFSSIVYMPASASEVRVGTRVVVADAELSQEELNQCGSQVHSGFVRIIGECARFDKRVLHCRMWL